MGVILRISMTTHLYDRSDKNLGISPTFLSFCDTALSEADTSAKYHSVFSRVFSLVATPHIPPQRTR